LIISIFFVCTVPAASVPLRGTGTVAARADAATADARRARRAYQVRACRTTLA